MCVLHLIVAAFRTCLDGGAAVQAIAQRRVMFQHCCLNQSSSFSLAGTERKVPLLIAIGKALMSENVPWLISEMKKRSAAVHSQPL